MKTETQQVKHGKDEQGKQKVVATITVPIYESIQEALTELGDVLALDLINRQNKVRLAGIERVKYTEAPVSKQRQRTIAFGLLTPEESARFDGKFQELLEFLDSDEMRQRVEAATSVAAVATS